MKRPYVAPVGECCGETYYTWDGWWSHQRRHHRKVYDIKQPYDDSDFRRRKAGVSAKESE